MDQGLLCVPMSFHRVDAMKQVWGKGRASVHQAMEHARRLYCHMVVVPWAGSPSTGSATDLEHALSAAAALLPQGQVGSGAGPLPV